MSHQGFVDRRPGHGAVLLVALLALFEVLLRLVVELLLLVLARLVLLLALVLLVLLVLVLLVLVLRPLLGVAKLLPFLVLRTALEAAGRRGSGDLLDPVEVLLRLVRPPSGLRSLAELLEAEHEVDADLAGLA